MSHRLIPGVSVDIPQGLFLIRAAIHTLKARHVQKVEPDTLIITILSNVMEPATNYKLPERCES